MYIFKIVLYKGKNEIIYVTSTNEPDAVNEGIRFATEKYGDNFKELKLVCIV